MATCPYCQETIAAGAQKCRYCHSVLFERSPEKGKDSAEFVIKFVGFSVAVLSCVGVISGIVFAALGVKSFGDLNQKLNADIEQVKTQIKQDTERLRIENNSLLHEVRASIIETSYERYQHIINSLVLDEISRPIVDELDQILSRVKSLKPHTKILEEKIGEIGSIIQSVKDYRSRDFEVALKIADATSARTPARYRMLCSINSQLVAKYSSSSKELAAKFLESFDNCTRIFLELSPTNDLAHSLRARAYMRMAIARKESEQEPLWLEAITHYSMAERYAPNRSYINYNMAACHAALKQYEQAVKQLEFAKIKGDFRKPGDIEFFHRDEEFRGLIEAAKNTPLLEAEFQRLGLLGRKI